MADSPWAMRSLLLYFGLQREKCFILPKKRGCHGCSQIGFCGVLPRKGGDEMPTDDPQQKAVFSYLSPQFSAEGFEEIMIFPVNT